ncbi:hypothetical protein PHYBLDRAFT_184795 [Phycomyces blakesleeanus NRRL 1555(-)]|uniref:DUF8032 domain-containing protein n=1 Tax=Phycomyces blakesleeanus (strain ATCC 8743b / DSM 1359 / FGSC 10004 / NBRC 33097 / NRRL 1555) TaxID=763407 RepID=A0A167QDE2_PHYB8|nr:hypothetical protein PHYBLDRAFT_184795 [Phycomyces blakesleeanus NRRL 1555(-)]OAD79528.1 hypothetical protein PHYBLDRAFT_184795 [Phycomyces blakesleeanus NRRL 1555(-)]|eukprot:XP_018297568.1 hypothetical protein PHYBLDRAFT_184795 [Phycomyces blakesleeanus NRRL 1555(-)]
MQTPVPELQLSVNDLLYPNKTAEILLDSLTTEQLNAIEQALYKLKEKKLALQNHPVISQPTISYPTLPQEEQNIEQNIEQKCVEIKYEEIKQEEVEEEMEQVDEMEEEDDEEEVEVEVEVELEAEIEQVKVEQTLIPEILSSTNPSIWDSTAAQVAKALAQAIAETHPHLSDNSQTKPPLQHDHINESPTSSTHEPVTEVRDGVEWVSFVYSHRRTLKNYNIRTDLETVDLATMDDKFKRDNCIYPRANLPKDSYRGNRWSYETECNVLGWQLAWLNRNEIASKRGLIQRAVDSYRNRYPSMRSRRVARQEKLLRGTLRKRKHREDTVMENATKHSKPPVRQCLPYTSTSIPRPLDWKDNSRSTTMSILVGPGSPWQLKVNIESVALSIIDLQFRKSNCVFPRALLLASDAPFLSDRKRDEAKCNEIGWQLAWLNPHQLANKKNLLQQVLDTFRNHHTPHLRPRKYSSRVPLTYPSLSLPSLPIEPHADEDNHSCFSGTTATLDFNDCFSPPPEPESPCVHSTKEVVQTNQTIQIKSEFKNVFDSLLSSLPLLQVPLSSSSSSSSSSPSSLEPMQSDDDINDIGASTNASGNANACGSGNGSISGSGQSSASPPVPELALAFDTMYQHALMVHSNDTLFGPTVEMKDYCDAIKYEDVSAGIDNFETNPLLNQLF